MQVSPSVLNVAMMHHSVIAWSSTHNIYGSSPGFIPFMLIMGKYDFWLESESRTAATDCTKLDDIKFFEFGSLSTSSLLDSSSTIYIYEKFFCI